ncbi:MAG TPA: acetoacetate decarboxylase family protein [Atribacterota bacterium]|nr:acetoacetate decarboxylase family protein [Atribacterota bacterium]
MKGKFKFKDDFVYKMPVHFGGNPFYPVRTVYHDMTSISIEYETDQNMLLEYIPEDFDLSAPVVKVQYNNSRDIDWMAGGEYRLIQVTVPVKYLGNSEEITGEYALVIWENKTCPIVGGREEDGVPKVFADISSERHYENRWFTSASYDSNTFLKIDFFQREELSKEDVEELNKNSKINLFGWRYLPNLGKGGAALSQATLYPQESFVKQVWTGEGSLVWNELKPEEHPLQWYIIKALAGLPIVKYLYAIKAKASAQLNVGDSKILP